MYIQLIIAWKYEKQKLASTKKMILMMILGDSNTTVSVNVKQQIYQDLKDLNSAISSIDLVDIYGMLQKTIEYIYFSST